jgi:hypothetical protein
MPAFCLMPEAVDKFKRGFVDGSIDPYKLNKMTSKDRHTFFSKLVGEDNAKGVNSLFESKILLKNQRYAYTAWAKKVAGITTETRRDLISRIEKMDHILNPAEEKQFLGDLAATRLGVDVTAGEAKKIATLSKQIEAAKAKASPDGSFKSESDRLTYGRAKVELGNYVNGLKEEAGKRSFKENLVHPVETVSKTAGLAKSVKASLDDSAIFRQGWKTLWTNPRLWQKNALKTFTDMSKELKGKSVVDEVTADIVSRKNYDRMVKAKLAVSTIEEAFPSQLPEKVPGLGRLYKASQSAYEGFVYRQRADVFDKYLEIAKKSGVNIDDKAQLESIGKLVNALTGRGYLGAGEKVANTVNNVFFAPRFIKSNIDTLTAHQLQKGVTPFVRKQAAENLVKIIVGTATVMAIAETLMPGSVETDPRSSNFGKIKVGHTTFDVTGGMAGLPTLVSRIMPTKGKDGWGQYTKGSGGLKRLNSGYGSQTGLDVVNTFFENKLSPAASVVKDLIKQQDFNGNKPTVKGELSNLFIPLPITNYAETKSDPQAANVLVTSLADAFGFATNTYGKSNKTWSNNPTKAQAEFKQSVSKDDFKAANDRYNGWVDKWTRDHDAELQKLSPEERQSTISGAKKKIEKSVMKQYGFKYKEPKPDKGAADRKKGLLKSIR